MKDVRLGSAKRLKYGVTAADNWERDEVLMA
ncbi:protein of unknown function [Candidatus Methylomirabilis oxygeniifera]|uniref:Uncharacterized protein n=1 Tax=Methylomirabilis oxygeniifera TaxID=671143 RepID=D5MGK5_METO1|nr:protein of unknown function [Candidatus Methylomirabilis oxyfera]